jgi:hypothetical protein
VPLYDSNIFKGLLHLRPSTFFGVDEFPGFISKGFTDIFVPLPKRTFNLSLPQQYFPTLRKQAVFVPGYERCNSASVSNYRPTLRLTYFHLSSALATCPYTLLLYYLSAFNLSGAYVN